jgi:hypothetical protein
MRTLANHPDPVDTESPLREALTQACGKLTNNLAICTPSFSTQPHQIFTGLGASITLSLTLRFGTCSASGQEVRDWSAFPCATTLGSGDSRMDF